MAKKTNLISNQQMVMLMKMDKLCTMKMVNLYKDNLMVMSKNKCNKILINIIQKLWILNNKIYNKVVLKNHQNLNLNKKVIRVITINNNKQINKVNKFKRKKTQKKIINTQLLKSCLDNILKNN